MYTIGVIFTVSLIVGMIIKIRNGFTLDELNPFGSAVIITILSALIVLVISGKVDREEVIVESIEYRLVSLNDKNDTEGSFVLGSGHVEEVSKYYFYYKVYGGYRLGSINASRNTTIVETDKIEPSIVKYSYKLMLSNKKLNGWLFGEKPVATTYKIFVPKETIVRNFVLDTKL